jgi:outer membrane receptor for ferrienterochelin and colicins
MRLFTGFAPFAFCLCTAGAFIWSAALAESPATPPVELAPIRVEDMRDRLERAGRVKDSIEKTEVISAQKIEKKQAKTLTEAVQNEPGVDAAVGCSICGMKRIQINGLRGEYTTVLVDGIPMHSTVSSYYGMDALTTAGVARIEVARGAGASLLAPGALAGTLNVISEKATRNGVYLDISGGNKDYRAFSLIGTSVDDTGKRRSTIAAQHSMQGQWDSDNNGVNESPRLGNYSLSGRVSQDLGASDNLDLRAVAVRSDVFGGPIADGIFRDVLQMGDPSFVDGDVRNPYNGPPGGTTETVVTERLEGTAKWTHEFNKNWNSTVSLSGSRQTQDSYYEGADYFNRNDTIYTDVRANWGPSTSHLITFGGDLRYEILRSQSVKFFVENQTPKDDFDFFSRGLYIQDVWTPAANLEVSTALRLDHLAVNWREQFESRHEVDQYVLVPRVNVRWNHAENWTSRLALGQGYRAPLTFFESEHGILDDGFAVAVTDIERSDSVVYSLSFDNRRATSTLSGSWTHLRNMAFIDTSTVVGPNTVPTLRNYPGGFSLFGADAVVGYQLTDAVLLGASYEHFWYPPGYQRLLPFAAIEDRVRFLVDYESGAWTWNLTANVVGPRDLRPYNYENRFNRNDATAPKLLDAPAFLTLDAKLSYQVDKDITVYVGAKNLLDYTQAKREGPLFWDENGEYDVIHVWGPLRGREVYAGLSARF